MIPVFRIGGTSILYIFLVVLVLYGTLHLIAATYPDSTFKRVWVDGLGF